MKRPYFVHFYAIRRKNQLALKGSIGLNSLTVADFNFKQTTSKKLLNPLDTYKRLIARKYQIRIIGENKEGKEIFNTIISTDKDGILFKILSEEEYGGAELHLIKTYELSSEKKVEFFLGAYVPLTIKTPFKLIISDFDRTLADTKYHSPKEIYESLTSSLNTFPTITPLLNILKDHIKKDFLPFILSASPHFYEESMRDWLYQQRIFHAEIFLKDFRKIFSLFNKELYAKDITSQGIYKITGLLTILNLTGLPEELVLMGDHFESDSFIYATLCYALSAKSKENRLYNLFTEHPQFAGEKKQVDYLLQLWKNLLENHSFEPKIHIYIRTTEQKAITPKEDWPDFLHPYQEQNFTFILYP